MNINKSELARNLPPRNIKKTRNNRLKLLIPSLLVTFLAGSSIFRELQLNTSRQLIHDCIEKKKCSENIAAIEKLVKAKKSLRLYNLRSTDLKNAHLANANLESVDLEHANLSNVHLKNADLKNANLAATQDFRIHLENANLEYVNFSNAHLEKGYLIHANLQGALLTHTHFYHAYLNRANLQGVHLYHADFEQANFHRANLSNSYLHSSNFHRANFYGANLHSAHIIEPQNLTPAQIKSACNWETAIYKGHWVLNQFQWRVDRIANEQFIKQLKKDRTSDPKKPVDCSLWK